MTGWGRHIAAGGLLLALALAGRPGSAAASVVSRLGDVYLYDPLSFDGGALQRSLGARGGVGTDEGALELGLDLPFYRDFSLRTAYLQRFNLDSADGHDVSWRLRMPVIESARFGRMTSAQAVYFGSIGLGEAPDPLLASHALGAAGSWARTGPRFAHSVHGALLAEVREPRRIQGLPSLARRVGIEARAAHLVQLWEPPAGPGGKWTMTVSTIELDVIHFGGPVATGGEGRATVVAGAPALHFTPRYATYTLGIVPRLTVEWGAGGAQVDAGGLLNLSVSYRTYLE